jgi:DNA-directed RNA polymerase specialized sigma24 family protein
MHIQPSIPCATPDEVKRAVAALTPVQIQRLRLFALYTLGGSAYSPAAPEELLQDAISGAWEAAKTVSLGQHQVGRAWRPGNISFEGFLQGAMRGIASDSRRSADRRNVVRGEDHEGYDDAHPEAFLVDLEAAVARARVEQAALDELKADPVMKALVEGLVAGKKPGEIQRDVGITPTEYESARRRLRRWTEKYRGGGHES